jgi:hypothetical protein
LGQSVDSVKATAFLFAVKHAASLCFTTFLSIVERARALRAVTQYMLGFQQEKLTMQVTITAYHDTATCTWCERGKCCVTVSFSDGFLQSAPLCWRCLQKAVRVRNRQTGSETGPSSPVPNVDRSRQPSAAPRREVPSGDA